MKALVYRARPMKWGPSDATGEGLRNMLGVLGRPVTVRLEPGDGTRYELLLVPCWGPGIRVPGTNKVAGSFIYVVGLEGSSQDKAICLRRGEDGLAFLERGFTRNEWSAEFLGWWFEGLWHWLDYGTPPTLDVAT